VTGSELAASGTALGSTSIAWPVDLWEGAVGLFDSIIRVYYGVYEFTDDPACVLRIGRAEARASILLSDGTRVEAGELIGTLHWWNEHLPRYSRSGPDFGWACARRDRMLPSLHLLALYIECESARRQIRALRGDAALSARLGAAQVQRLAGRYGFERVPRDPSILRRLHALGDSLTLWATALRCGRQPYAVGDSLTLWGLTRAYNPAALARQPFLRDHHELWISRAALLERYSDGPSPAAGGAPLAEEA
jgi:hypothetical protein